MNGLEERLRKVSGVADLTLELGDDGLTGITVRVDDSSDEAVVLEEIRRILVAYGLRSRRSVFRSESVPELDLGSQPTPNDTEPQVRVEPEGDELVVTLRTDGRRYRSRGPASPHGAAEAMANAVAEWLGHHPPERVAVRRVDVEGDRCLVVVLGASGSLAAGAALEAEGLSAALLSAVRAAYQALD